MANRFLTAMLVLETLALAFALSVATLDDPDVWWHLKCGEMLLRDGVIPRTDVFSYTASGARWVDGYLPAQTILYGAWRVGGPAGVIVLSALLVAGAYALAIAMCRRAGAGFGVSLMAAMPSVFLARIAFVPRPALLSPIFALVTLWLLEDHRVHGGKRVYWLIPLTALWANCHPGFIMGPMLTAIYVAGGVIGDRSTIPYPDAKAHRARLDLIVIGQVLATLVNPYHYHVYSYAISLFSDPQMKSVIMEWQPLFGMANAPGVVPCFIAVTAIWVASLIYAGCRAPRTYILLFLFFMIMTLYARRNLIVFGPLSLPLIAWAIGAGGRQVAFPQWIRKAAVKAGAFILIVGGLFMIWFVGTNRLNFYTMSRRSVGTGISEVSLPAGGVRLLKDEPVAGNLINTYGVGGYLIFELYPKFKVYIDGRFYPYPRDMMQIETDPLWFPRNFESVRSRYDIRAALIPIFPGNHWPALMYFLITPEWAVVEADEWGVLFLARGVGNDEVIKRHEIDILVNPPMLEAPHGNEALHWWSRVEYPHGPVRWAMFYDSLGRPDLAVKALKPALAFKPHSDNIVAQYDLLVNKAEKMGAQ